MSSKFVLVSLAGFTFFGVLAVFAPTTFWLMILLCLGLIGLSGVKH